MPNFIGSRADGRTDRHEEANSCISQFCKRDKNRNVYQQETL